MQQADGLHLSERDLFLQLGTILQVDDLFVNNGLLQHRQILLRRLEVGRIPDQDLDMLRQTVYIFFVRRSQHRFYLEKGRVEMPFYRSIGELLRQFGPQQQGAGLLLGEHDGRQPVPFHNGIAGTRLADDRYAGFIQGFDVPVDRPQADLKAVGHFLGRHFLFALQMGENGM